MSAGLQESIGDGSGKGGQRERKENVGAVARSVRTLLLLLGLGLNDDRGSSSPFQLREMGLSASLPAGELVTCLVTHMLPLHDPTLDFSDFHDPVERDALRTNSGGAGGGGRRRGSPEELLDLVLSNFSSFRLHEKRAQLFPPPSRFWVRGGRGQADAGLGEDTYLVVRATAKAEEGTNLEKTRHGV